MNPVVSSADSDRYQEARMSSSPDRSPRLARFSDSLLARILALLAIELAFGFAARVVVGVS